MRGRASSDRPAGRPTRAGLYACNGDNANYSPGNHLPVLPAPVGAAQVAPPREPGCLRQQVQRDRQVQADAARCGGVFWCAGTVEIRRESIESEGVNVI
jgi:hypothetical protein